MFLWVFFLGTGSGVYTNPTYYTGILHPVVDTAGHFSTNDDPDTTDEPEDLSTALNPT